jgi:hypothetical protein
MAAPSKLIAAGGKYAFMSFINTNGFLTGSNTTDITAGSSRGAALLEGFKTASPTVPEPDTVQVTGDDILIGEFDFDSIAERRFTGQFAIQDLDMQARMLGVEKRTVAGIDSTPYDIATAPEQSALIIFQSRAKKQDTGTRGQSAWNGVIMPASAVKPLGREAFTEREAAVFNLSITPQLAGYDALGLTISDAIHGTTGYRYETFASDYPVHIQPIRGDGSTVTFNLDYTPVSASLTAVYVNRVAATVSSVSTGNKTVTVSVAPATGLYGLVFYQFNG